MKQGNVACRKIKAAERWVPARSGIATSENTSVVEELINKIEEPVTNLKESMVKVEASVSKLGESIKNIWNKNSVLTKKTPYAILKEISYIRRSSLKIKM